MNARDEQVEPRALPDVAFHPNAATEQSGEAAAQRQPETGASGFALQAILDLLKVLEMAVWCCAAIPMPVSATTNSTLSSSAATPATKSPGLTQTRTDG